MLLLFDMRTDKVSVAISLVLSQYRKAKTRLSRYRNQLSVEVGKFISIIGKAKENLRIFDNENRVEEIRLVRLGLRKHLPLHQYYSTLQVGVCGEGWSDGGCGFRG